MKLLKKLILIVCFFISFNGYGQKITLMMGGYSFSAQTSTKKAQLTNIGSFSFEYAIPVKSQFEFFFGYTLNLEGGLSGDIAYGLDIGTKYFPFQWTNDISASSSEFSLSIQEKMRPYFGLSFHQRQFQSIHTSYAGFGLTAGLEYRLLKNINLSFTIRSLSLSGPDKASASIIESLVGMIYHF